MTQRSWYQKNADEVISELNSSRDGITAEEAAKRLAAIGPNELTEKKRKSPLLMFLDQFTDFMILVLIGAAVVSGIIGEITDTIVILIILILNAIIGFVQEYRAEHALAALKKMASPMAIVFRSGEATRVPASQLVPGDIVSIEAGMIVPSDMRLFEGTHLKVEEAALTGESVPIEKLVSVIDGPPIPLADRINMVFKGTIVAAGRGKGIVVSTGMNTELGKIAAMLESEGDVKTPLQKRLTVFGRKLAIAVLFICALVFFMGVARGEAVMFMLLTAISLAVAAIPEALPAVVTISLALGAKKLVRQNALIKKLPAVETLGSVTYICSDKTGTLTLNRMTVEEIWVDGQLRQAHGDGLKGFREFFTGLALNNDSQESLNGTLLGDPTELALYQIAREQGFEKQILETEMERVAEIPFDSERKRMTTFHTADSRLISFTKGAVDTLLDRCDKQWTMDGPVAVDRDAITNANQEMAKHGLRIIALAMRHWDQLPDPVSIDRVESNLMFLGLAGMMDPPRPEAAEAVGLCKTAGIRPVMITGDHPVTAQTIARRVGILEDGAQGAVLSGAELGELDLEEFEKRVEHIRVYARVAPEQKLKIVKALQDRGHFVGMTGDGVNDAPALKRADIGIAMGITGTDVSKEAAHMVLLDDNFATIVKAVREGRRIFDNIRKFIKYTMTSNSGEIWSISLAPLLGLPIPLLPIHILWINLVTDGLPGLALAREPGERDLMNRPPRPTGESVFAHGMWQHIIWVGVLMAALVLGTQYLSIETQLAEWQTMVFTVLCLTQLGHVLAIRSERESIFTQGFFSNMPLLGAVAFTFALQMATIYVPFLNPIFRTQPLTLPELILTLLVSSLVFVAVELEKWVKRWYRSRSRKPGQEAGF